MSILPCSWGDACLQEGENHLLFSLPGALPEARPVLTLCSGHVRAEAGSGVPALSADGHAELRVRLLPSSCCSPGASEAPWKIGSNEHLKGANTSQERGQNPAFFCCFASVPMKNKGSHCQSSWEPRAFFCSHWQELAAPRRWQLSMSRNPQWDRGRNLPSKIRGEAVELFTKLVLSSQAGRGITCSIA